MFAYRRLSGTVAAAFAVCALAVSAGASVPNSAGINATCTGGSVPSGTYLNLDIAGACNVDTGSVQVENNLTVLSGGTLIAAFGGSNLDVAGNVEVRTNGILVLGCEPLNYICLNDPDQTVGSYTTRDHVGGSLKANDALAILVHLTVISHDVAVNGGGGGITCADPQPALGGSPPFGDFEDNIIGGSLRVTGWQSCWLGFFRDAIAHDVEFNNNVTADPDGNELTTNSIAGSLSCSGNTPAPQPGDSGGSLNNVFGHARGQCANPKLVR